MADGVTMDTLLMTREEITSYAVYKAAMAGDTLAREVFRQTGTRIGWKAEAKLEDVLASAWKWQQKLRADGIM